jgi:CheY-like chemotaxis protein
MSEKTILLVDDDSQHLKLYSLVLKKAGFRPITTLVGSTSLSLHDEIPALILLDYRLNSSLNACQVAELLRQRFPHAPIVVLSSHDKLPEDMRGLAEAFLHKDDPQDLVALARKMLKMSN